MLIHLKLNLERGGAPIQVVLSDDLKTNYRDNGILSLCINMMW